MAITTGKKPPILAFPYPAQGHVVPLIKLSRLITTHRIKVTFVTTEHICEKLLSSMLDHDGLPPQDDRCNAFKVFESLKNTAGGYLTDLIEKINESNSDEKISCVIADVTIGWVLENVEKLGLEGVAFAPVSAATLAMTLHISKLIEEGRIDENDLNMQKIFFECSLINQKAAYRAKWLLCNTFYKLESSACDLIPNLLPGKLQFCLCREDTTCLSWLDGQLASSAIYVAFGSYAVFSQHQLDERALGLELSGQPFLWVVRPDLANRSWVEFLDGFLERVGSTRIGKIVKWAPQEKVLCHRSIGCFLSHCGWNLTVEGLSKGVPFLCWPYCVDQLHNQKYICDKWRIGLRIDPDGNGIRTRIELKKKIEMLFHDDSLRVNALRFKKMAMESVDQGGSPRKNFEKFIDHLKE
ncbi:UDP-glucuronosyl and UDP-glucosyl transferase [Handroanthus impetiginosus]|uniref:UDP-glucuronosyl and UDP-glucosyl transferase n=1 Tax=Handroanthus impetiginosus TaxID=429701 RepID=A0A2G9GGA1_9LAMI|nr:UDP-glucuronosyl and UDP-glucosyl transferase [Handroanthus impetiginosus]